MQGHKNQWRRKEETKKEREREKNEGRVEKYANHAKSPSPKVFKILVLRGNHPT